MESPKPKTSSQNEEKNMTSYEKVKNAKDTIHHHIDDLYPDAENQKKEESHLSLELAGNKKQYEAIWDNLIAFFAQEKKKAEKKGDTLRLEELREKFESVKSAFKEILNASRELDTFGDMDGVQEAQDALEEKAEEIGNEITGEEEGTAKKYELNKKNEAIRKIEGNESAKKLLVLLEDEQIIDDASHVNVEKLIHRVLKEYSNIDEFEADLMRVMNEKLSNEDKNEHRWDGFPLLVEELQNLYEAKNEEVNSKEDSEEKEDNSKEEGEEGIEDRENPSEEEEVKDDEEKGDSETGVEDKNKEKKDSDKEGKPEGNCNEEKTDSGKEQRETKKGDIMTALEKQKDILRNRKIGHIKHVIEQFADRERLLNKTSKGNLLKRAWRFLNARDTDDVLHKKYIRGLDLSKKDTKDLTEEEKKFLLSLDLKQFVNEKNLEKNKETFDSYILKKEHIRLLEGRLMKLEGDILRDEVKDKNFLTKGFNEFRVLWKKFKVWHENPENKRELRKRIRFTVGASVGAGLLGAIFAPAAALTTASGILTGGFARMPLSYAGGESFRWIYNKTYGKDFRKKMRGLRTEYQKELNWLRETVKDPDIFKEELARINENYKKKSNELLGGIGRFVNKQQSRRIWADRAGRIAGALAATGLQYLEHANAHEHVTPIDKEIKPVPIDQHPSPDLPSTVHEGFSPFKGDVVDSDLLTKDIFIKPGDGVTQIIQRQLQGNSELAKLFGIKDGSPLDYKHLAKAFGYMNEKGQVLLKLKPDHGYLATFIEAGGKKIPAIMEVDKAGHLIEAHILNNGKLSIVDDVKNIVSHVAENAKTIEHSYEYWGDLHKASEAVNDHTVEVINNASQQVQDHTVEVLNGAQEAHKHTVEVLSQTPLRESVQTVSNGTISPVEISQHAETLPTGDYEPIPYHEHARRAVRELRRYPRRRGGFTLNLNIGGGFLGRLLGIGRSLYPHNLPRIPISTRGVGRVGRTIRAGVSAMHESNQ